jgi:DNA-binding NtrC family response regulator/ATP/maltotriose-dependent transcriptional regulator MalT
MTTPRKRQTTETEETVLRRVSHLIDEEDTKAARELLAELSTPTAPGNRFDAVLLKARLDLMDRRYSELANTLDQARELIDSPAQKQQVDLLDAHAKALTGNARSAFHIVRGLLRDMPRIGEARARASWIAGLSCYRCGHYAWARRFTQESASYYRLVGNQPLLANLLVNVALIDKSEGRIDVALAHLDEAMNNLPADGFVRIRTRMLINRSVCFLKLGHIETACTCLMEARRLASSERETSFLVSINNNLGHIYRMRGNFDLATEFHAAALSEARTYGSERKECLALEFLGETAVEAGNFTDAQRSLDRAFALAGQIAPQGDLMMEVLRRRGELWAALGEPESAARELRRCVELCESRNERREALLARRALLLNSDVEADAFRRELNTIVEGLSEQGDRFEYARTVCLALELRAADVSSRDWFRDAVAAAAYHLDTMGLSFWKSRLRANAGYKRGVDLQSLSPSGGGASLVPTSSPAFQECLSSAKVATRSSRPVMILGETGVGKEVLARLLHSWGPRAAQPLVAINCGAIPDHLVESELFGYARGAFSGAQRDKKGLLEAANGGTVFLDEVRDLPLPAQVKLLRFLDSGEFRRVGETTPRHADARVISATNQDLADSVRAGLFRQDLFYRLNVFQLHVPPLRERREDIILLAQRFIESVSPGASIGFDDALRDWMLRYDWPGNVRELRNLCEYLAAKGWGKKVVTLADVPTHMQRSVDLDNSTSVFEFERLDLERRQILSALRQSNWRILHAAKLLGMSRNTVAKRMKALGIATPRSTR